MHIYKTSQTLDEVARLYGTTKAKLVELNQKKTKSDLSSLREQDPIWVR